MSAAPVRPWSLLLVIAALMLSLWPAGPAQAGSPPDAADPPDLVAHVADPAAVRTALGLDPSMVTSISFGNSDPLAYGVLTNAAAGMPTHGTSYVALTNGQVDSVFDLQADLASWAAAG